MCIVSRDCWSFQIAWVSLISHRKWSEMPSIFKRDYSGLCRGGLGSARILREVFGILPGTSVNEWPRAARLNIDAVRESKVVW